ncbi:mammalian cell entry protein [Mycobacterium paraffinicum]|uniref:Mammalian cell entry protein n=1 Tax=Mycobacterium paraffinicum TaxID=53378 RepID=A0A1Q4I211_9MYCO|nr:MCE family protein [Mycobacterium paraffinicum]OJZ75906.1 mammalian cell entry protein [Mycobacterium paraffinicum]
MSRRNIIRVVLAVALVAVIAVGVAMVVQAVREASRIYVTAYFDNSNGVFAGDDVRIRGVNVGKIDSIEPQPKRVKITFWFDDKYRVPADAKAVIISPTLVTARAIQLTPAYHGGPAMADKAVIPEDRTAVPMEWDDFRKQLQRLTEMLQPNQPGGVSTLGALINTTADNVRGQGGNIRDAITRLSQTISALGDHSSDTFTTVKNLSALVSGLQDSTDVISQLNRNLAAVTGALADDPHGVGNAVKDLNDVVGEVQTFVADNRETVGTTSDKLTELSQTLVESLDDIKQFLHATPTVTANSQNLYQPAQGTLSGVLAANNFADPLTFLCGAIQAASRLRAEQSAKLCVQYLAPIMKNRQYNFLPLGENLFVGAAARPNELTYSIDSMRPDYVPPQPNPAAPAAPPPESGPPTIVAPPPAAAPAPINVPQPTDPAAGLQGLMLPQGPGGGS